MVTNKASSVNTTQQASIVSKDARERRRIDIQNVQNVLLIWLDSNIDDNSEECQNIITQLQHVVTDVNIFIDIDQCIEFIETIKDRKACMIISGWLGQYIVPRVHDMLQVDSIFILCGNKTRHEKWAKEWLKIKGVFIEIKSICQGLKQAAQQCEQNAMSMSFMASGKRLDQLDPSFMYTQILKEILLSIDFDNAHIEEFVQYCPDALVDNKIELKNIEQLVQKYHQNTPIWWYTKESVLYPMLNRALREINGDIITRMGFFINDLYRHIAKVHKEQYTAQIFTVYRGQGLSKSDFEQLKQTQGGLMSFNNFLSTSKVLQVSLPFAQNPTTNPDLVGVLFIMEIDPRQTTIPFASIRGISYFPNEDEVLFSMHSVFRVHDIKPMDASNRLYEVNLTLTSDNDKELSALTDRIREESFPYSKGWYRLGQVLSKLGQNDKAEEIYRMLLDKTTEESEKAPLSHQLGSIKRNQGKYSEAITFFEKSIEIEEKNVPLNHSNLANSYNNISVVYRNIADYPKALSYHEKALAILQQSLPPNHPDLASSYNNIGLMFNDMGDYPKALSFHEKSLAILQQSLPSNHPALAVSYNNIGIVYKNMDEYPKALFYYDKTLIIRQQSLPLNHPDLAQSYNNMGVVYDKMADYPKALSCYEKALAIKQQSLPSNHPGLASSCNNIGLLYDNMGDYLKACSFYERAVQIGEHSLPDNHPDLVNRRQNLERVKKKL